MEVAYGWWSLVCPPCPIDPLNVRMKCDVPLTRFLVFPAHKWPSATLARLYVGRHTRGNSANRPKLNQCLRLSCGHPHNLKVVGSNPTRATTLICGYGQRLRLALTCQSLVRFGQHLLLNLAQASQSPLEQRR